MNLDRIVGTAWCYGDNINTDLIYPGRYLSITTPSEMAKHALEGLDIEFSKKVQKGDVLVAGSNFGSGSSREQAAMCLKHTGLGAIVAVSFARIFYRNIINQGVPAIISQVAVKIVRSGDSIELDFTTCQLKNLTTGDTCTFEPIPEFLQDIIKAGGYIQYLRKRLMV